MAPSTLEAQLIKHLTDVHSIGRQALVQMKAAPKVVDGPKLREAFITHLSETEEHERLVRGLLEARGSGRSEIKDLAGVLTEQGKRVGDEEAAQLAARIAAEEQAMADRIEGLMDRAVGDSLRDKSPDELGEQPNDYLADTRHRGPSYAAAGQGLRPGRRP